MASILVLNGPNLNLLGTREPEQYGRDTLESIGIRLKEQAIAKGHALDFIQSNSEQELIERVQDAGRDGNEHFVLLALPQG